MWTYFAKGSITGLVKIGRAANVKRRLRQLQHGSPDELILLGVAPDSIFPEGEMHKKFSQERLHGEWFTPSPRLMQFIAENASAEEPESSEIAYAGLLRTPGSIGWLIKGQRVLKRLTQADLAEQVGVSRQWIIDVENGHSRAEIGLVLRALAALGVSLNSEEKV
jgi:DNA-binding XRE family transcriptional regulator